MRSIFFVFLYSFIMSSALPQSRTVQDFDKSWRFFLGDDSSAKNGEYNDAGWRLLNLPHDWSIEGTFSESYPTTANEGALPAGIGWYRKTFILPSLAKGKRVYIAFDGVYRNSEVWINGHYLGKRPNGYISFQYELTDYLQFGTAKNVIAVKVDNSGQPNSRWYSGSGIYRNVYLITTNKVAIAQWGTFVTTSLLDENKPVAASGKLPYKQKVATINIRTDVQTNFKEQKKYTLISTIYDSKDRQVAKSNATPFEIDEHGIQVVQQLIVSNPTLWSVHQPALYKVINEIMDDGKVVDRYQTSFGIRTFYFDAAKGFFLNGEPLKILGVCNHHDLGALGAAVNKRAIERQLEILKKMGCNAIRTAHNPPAPELLNLCDSMGFIVMDEAFDMWEKGKNKQDYHLDFKDWHRQDLEDQVKRDRNHPSVFIWSIGNEIREQFDTTGIRIAKDLAAIVRSLDTTRPVTSALTENVPEKNFIYQSGALDVLGFNYKLEAYPDLPKRFPNQKFLASETMSALATRGHYDMPSDSIRLWPPDSKTKFASGNPDFTVSAYDNTYAYWGSSHEAGWNAEKKYPFMAGIFVWSGFDFLGEPVPYPYPARSAYYGIIDLAGFPKDVYYMYQSEWTDKPVLHLFPHWNWKIGDSVDVWAYYNHADEVELFLNNRSLGIKKKTGDALHVQWRVAYKPGTLKAISRSGGKTVLTEEIKTAGKPAKIELVADRKLMNADGKDLSFITVKIVDASGIVVPDADNLVHFKIKGEGFLAGVDNGSQTSHESFKAPQRKAFNGLCLAIIQATEKIGTITIEATADGLQTATLTLKTK